MRRSRPVARILTPAFVGTAALVTLMALVCVVGAVLSLRSVAHLTGDVEGARDAHAGVLQDLTAMDAAVGAWVQSGTAEARADYRRAAERFDVDSEAARRLADADDAALAVEQRRLDSAARAWVRRYAAPRIAAAGGPGTFSAADFRTGRTLFTQVERVHDEVTEVLDDHVADAEGEATWRLSLTIGLVVLLALAALYLVRRSHRRLVVDLSEPLQALEVAVQRMTRTDPDTRAEARGPQEVRAVATALNEYADAQGRAQAVEGRIQDELRVLDSAKDDFVSNVSHELRTPLTTISGYLELVAEEFEDRLEPRHERMLEATRRNVSRLKALIDDLLALSKAENRDTDLEAADVTDLVRDSVTDVRITGARRGIRVEVAAPPSPMLVLSDRAMLQRALLNVLSNAVKFSHDGGLVEVTVARHGEEMVEVAVRDHGLGIPRAELDRLGTRFFRASNAVTQEIAGTGLGLRIVQTIVDKHAGDVVIESEEGEGTTVRIRLRLHGASASAATEDVAAPAATPEPATPEPADASPVLPDATADATPDAMPDAAPVGATRGN